MNVPVSYITMWRQGHHNISILPTYYKSVLYFIIMCFIYYVFNEFVSTCQNILDTVAPLKVRQPKSKSESWLNDSTRAARRQCRTAEWKWKKDKLHVSYDI